MGYRQYLYSVDTWLVDEIRKCKTQDEFIATMQRLRNDIVEYDSFDGSYYVHLWELGDCLFEFGKYYGNSDEMYKHGDSLFSSDELRELYSDYGAIIIDEDGLMCAIEWNRKKVCGLYQDLLREKAESDWDNRSQLDRLVSHANDYLYWWNGTGPGNLSKENNFIVSSWLYEHVYFELVRIYKTFDWDNKSMLFLGW